MLVKMILLTSWAPLHMYLCAAAVLSGEYYFVLLSRVVLVYKPTTPVHYSDHAFVFQLVLSRC